MSESHPAPPALEFGMTISINLGKAYWIRPSQYGSERAAVYLLDGTVRGPALNGIVVPNSGGDCPWVRPDGGGVCLMAVLGNYFGLKAFAWLSGTAIAINTTLSAIAPYVAGYLFDHGYGYGGICYVLAAWCFVGALILFAIRRPAPPATAAA